MGKIALSQNTSLDGLMQLSLGTRACGAVSDSVTCLFSAGFPLRRQCPSPWQHSRFRRRAVDLKAP
jgi:hypothetical protein